MATILTMDQAITNVPASTPTIQALGDVIASDKFNRAGPLQGSQTDSFAGGQPLTWGGLQNSGLVTSTTGGGQLQINAAGVSSLTVDAGRPDAIMSMKLVSGNSAQATGQNAMIEFRKAQANTGDTYRLTLGPYNAATGAPLSLHKRISGGASLVAESFRWMVGDVLKIDIKGNRIRIYRNDMLQNDVTDNSITTGNFFGFATSSNNKPWIVTDFILRSN